MERGLRRPTSAIRAGGHRRTRPGLTPVVPTATPAEVVTPDASATDGTPTGVTSVGATSVRGGGGVADGSGAQSVAPPPPRTLLDEWFIEFPHGWPHDPGATAWFSDETYRLFVRGPERVVAVRAPIDASIDDVVVTAAFRKVGGPTGGGYGVIVREPRQTWCRRSVLVGASRRQGPAGGRWGTRRGPAVAVPIRRLRRDRRPDQRSGTRRSPRRHASVRA
jgi:hypothetical protein